MTGAAVMRFCLRTASRLGPFVIFVGVWQLLSMTGVLGDALVPSAVAVGKALVALLGSAEVFVNLGFTLWSCFIGLAFGAVIGISIGTGMALSHRVNGFFSPLIKATYSLPKTSLVPLFILWFGVGTTTNVVAIILAALLPIVIYTYHGILDVPQVLIWSALAMDTPRRQLIWRILLPSALQSIMTGLRIALGFSFVIGIAAEMIAANFGIGKLISVYGSLGSYDYMFAGIIVLVTVVYFIDRGLVVLTAHLLRWQDTVQQHA
jgi:NitT/TauT family transport system permease protein